MRTIQNSPGLAAIFGTNPYSTGALVQADATKQPRPSVQDVVGATPYSEPSTPRQNTGSSMYGGGAGSSRASVDPNVLAQYDQSINTTNSALGRLPNQLGIAQGNINRRYSTNLNELDSAKNQARSSFDTSVTQNKQNYRTDKNTINDSASAGLRGLLRTLGAYGAGGSSDALYVAPQAVATQASQERAGAGQNFSQNAQSLDTNWNNFLSEDDNSRRKLNDWKTEQLNSAQAQSDNTRADLLSKLAELSAAKAAYNGGNGASAAQPYIDQANSLLRGVDELARINPTYSGTTPVYSAPSLGSYTVNEGGAPTTNVDALQSVTNPYTSLLLGLGRRDERNGLGV